MFYITNLNNYVKELFINKTTQIMLLTYSNYAQDLTKNNK